MIDNVSKVVDWLKRNPSKYFCWHCVSDGTGVTPQAQVNQIVKPLGQTKEFRYMKTKCDGDGCKRDLTCIGYFK